MNDNSDIPILGQNVDQSQIPPIDSKRMVAFINHFIINTVQFLNEFMTNVESKFIEFESKLQSIESSLIIVEAKLASIPDVGNQKKPEEKQNDEQKSEDSVPIESTISVTNATQETSTLPSIEEPSETDGGSSNENKAEIVSQEPNQEKPNGVKACDDSRYRKYFKMVQFGVPPPAVKLKMQAEGFDPNILDDPNRILEDGIDSNVSEEA